MKATCNLKGHSNKPLTLICTHSKCPNSHLLCSKCLSLHKECLDQILDIEGVLKRSFVDNINWIKDNEIRQAIFLIDEYKLLGGKNQLFEIYEELLNKEFERLIQSFIEKTQETKARMLVNAKQLYDVTKIDLDGFKTQLESLYNFDVLVGILEPLEKELDDFSTVNMQLNYFFEEIGSRKTEERTLKEMARTLNAYAKQFLEIDKRPFEDFIAQIPFHSFDTYPCNMWSWDTDRKSKSISLSEDKLVAKKQAEPCVRPTAVVGSREFSRGIHEWEVSVASGREDHDWICFGIIEAHLVKDLDALPSSDAMRLSTVGHSCQLDSVRELTNYDNKTYLCNLDLENGTFTISYHGQVIAKEHENVKGKTVVPFVSVKYPGNQVKLRVIRSL